MSVDCKEEQLRAPLLTSGHGVPDGRPEVGLQLPEEQGASSASVHAHVSENEEDDADGQLIVGTRVSVNTMYILRPNSPPAGITF